MFQPVDLKGNLIRDTVHTIEPLEALPLSAFFGINIKDRSPSGFTVGIVGCIVWLVIAVMVGLVIAVMVRLDVFIIMGL